MGDRDRSPRRFWLRAAVAAGGAGLCALAALAWVIADSAARAERFAQARDPRGAMIDVGGERIFATLRGQNGPVIAIEAGLGSSLEWWRVADQLAAHARVLTYDRPGYGWSPRQAGPHDADAAARRLSGLLAAMRLEPPYLLVGESIGALYVQRFVRAHPRDVAGVVLVHPVSPDHDRFARELSRAFYQNLINLTPRIQVAGVLARLGITRAAHPLPFRAVHVEPMQALLEFYAAPGNYETMLAEYRALGRSAEQVRRAPAFPARPLSVVHHCARCLVDELTSFRTSLDEAEQIEALWASLDRDLAALSPRGVFSEAEASTHYLHVEEPDLVAKRVLDCLRSAWP
jgi:pimeloyl-ACP methyl ester carboxylesterase